MDTISISGTALLSKVAQTQQAMAISITKQAAEQQNQMANLLAQNARLAPQPTRPTDSGFSIYV